MHPDNSESPNRRLLHSALVALILCLSAIMACTLNEEITPTPTPSQFTGMWQGTYHSSSAGDSGLFVLDLAQNGSDATGELVVRSATGDHRIDDVRMIGKVVENRLQLGLDRTAVPYQYDLTLSLVLGDSVRASGTLFQSIDTLEASVRSTRLHAGTVSIIDSVLLHDYVISVGYSGDRLWISTIEHFLTAHTLPGPLDTIDVTISIGDVNDLHWTSSTLASNGSLLWGDLPASINHGASYSHILTFDSGGTVRRSVDIPYRTAGLAHDGSSLWTLCSEPNMLYRLGTSGAFSDSIPIPIPDATHLEYAEASFWTLGWYLKKLYRIGNDGGILAVYDLPRALLNLSPLGIAYDGTDYWYARELPVSSGRASILYRLHIQ